MRSVIILDLSGSPNFSDFWISKECKIKYRNKSSIYGTARVGKTAAKRLINTTNIFF
jgi:hypothetical protein